MTRTPWLTRRSALKTGAIAAGVAGIGARSGAAQDDESPSDNHCYYQVDFVAGDPIETLGVSDDAFYGRQNRLIQYVHADGDDVIERDTWLNSLDPEIRQCVTTEPIQIREGTASVEFTVADGCERQLSLAVYPLPGGEFSFEERQELAAATTETFGPGTHELTVEAIRGPGCPPQPSIGYEQRAKLVAADAEFTDYFGGSVAVSGFGDTAVIGAYEDDTDGGEASGSVYVFDRANETWTQRAKLTADDVAAWDRFGISVAVSESGDTAVIGAERDDTDAGEGAGSVYVFSRTNGTWTQRAKLTAADAAEADGFGISVAVSESGETAVIGAHRDDHAGKYTGSAYVFTRTDGAWTQQTKLTAADAAEYDWFGISVAVSGSGNTAVIGARGDDHAGERSGSAYVFTRMNGTWTQQAKLIAADAAEDDLFGDPVAVSDSGETAVIGADGDDDAGERSGSAYVFTRTDGTWTQQAKLVADDAAELDVFGWSVAVSGSGDTAVIGAERDDTDAGEGAGSVYVFSRANGTWTQQTKLTADDAEGYDSFGGSVAVSDSGETVLIGADEDDTDAGSDAGSVYVFGR